MPVGRVAVGIGGILGHGRHGDAVLDHHLAQLEAGEHRRGPGLAIILAGLAIQALVERGVDAGDEVRVAHEQVVVGDRLGATHDDHGELLRAHVPGAVHVLEPGQRHVGIVLDDLAGGAPLVLVGLERGVDVGFGLGDHRVGQGDRAFHGELGAGADRVMRRRLGVAEQHDVLVRPLVAIDAGELSPVGAVQQQGMAGQFVGVEKFQRRFRLGFVHAVEAVAAPAGIVHLEDPGGAAGFVLIGVGADDAVVGLAEEIVELAHRPGRAHPAESVGFEHD